MATQPPELPHAPSPASDDAAGDAVGRRVEGSFTENAGQLGEAAGSFYSFGDPMSVCFGRGWVGYHLVSAEGKTGTLYRMRFVGGIPAEPEGSDPLGYPTSFFVGDNPSGWRTGVRSYASVVYRGLYEGVDARFYFSGGDLEYDVALAAGTDPSRVRISYDGVASLSINPITGDLIVSTPSGTVTEAAPRAFQPTPHGRIGVHCAYALGRDGLLGFEVPRWDANFPLVIDPRVGFAARLGGSLNRTEGVAVDAGGAIYLTGRGDEPGFPPSPGTYPLGSFGTGVHVYVLKLDARCSALQYATFIGGTIPTFSMDPYRPVYPERGGYSIATDGHGCAYVVGLTDVEDFPLTEGAPQGWLGGFSDAFALKLSSNGTELLYSTYLGGEKYDAAVDVSVDDAGCAHVMGSTYGFGFPITQWAYDGVVNAPGEQDIFVTKLDPSGGSLVFSTFVGGYDQERGGGIAVGPDGCSYVTGISACGERGTFPTTPGAFDRGSYRDWRDECFVFRLSADGKRLLNSTLLGGSGRDWGCDIDLDGSSSVYVTGFTASDDFPVTSGAFDTCLNDADPEEGEYGSDAFVCKLDATLSRQLYSTYLGSASDELWTNVDVDAAGFAYTCGLTCGSGLPDRGGALQPAYGGGQDDGFFAKLGLDGSALAYSTYLGGSTVDWCTDLAVGRDGSCVVVGNTDSPDFPNVTDGSLNTSSEGYDTFVIRFLPECHDPVTLAGGPVLYARWRTYEFRVDANPTRSAGPPTGVALSLDPWGEAVELKWDAGGGAHAFAVGADPLDCIELVSGPGDAVEDLPNGTVWLSFRVVIDWTWPHELPCDAIVETFDDAGVVLTYVSRALFSVENDLQLIGDMSAETDRGPLQEGGWVGIGEAVTAWGPMVVYEGTQDKYPPEGSCVVVLVDDEGDNASAPSAGDAPARVTVTSDPVTDMEETLRMMLRDVPGDEVPFDEPTFAIRVDGELPTFRNHVPDGDDWHSSSQVMVAITADDSTTSGVDASTLEYCYSTSGAEGFTAWSIAGLSVTSDGPAVDGMVTIALPDGDSNYVRWRAKDLVGNGYAVSEPYRVKVDTVNVTYTGFTPEGWQRSMSCESGVTIRDSEGSGIDVATVQYRVSRHNMSSYGPWTPWGSGGGPPAREVEAKATVDLSETPYNYVQWRAMDVAGNGYTTSPHHRIGADVTPVSWGELSPRSTELQNTSAVTCWVTVTDGSVGSGVDAASVEARYVLSDGRSIEWSPVGMTGSAQTLRFSVLSVVLPDGTSSIELRGWDVAGNGPSSSSVYGITVDTQGPSVENMTVAPRDGGDIGEYCVTARLVDRLSGLDLGSVAYLVERQGSGPIQDWQAVVPEPSGDRYQVDFPVTLPPGRTYRVVVRASDALGTATVAEGPWIQVNAPPVARISSPADSTDWTGGEPIPLDAQGSADPEGGALDYAWSYRTNSSATWIPCGAGARGSVTLGPGAYVVMLTVRDGDGSANSVSVNVTVRPPPAPRTVDDGAGNIWAVALLLIVAFVTLVAVMGRRRAKGRTSGGVFPAPREGGNDR